MIRIIRDESDLDWCVEYILTDSQQELYKNLVAPVEKEARRQFEGLLAEQNKELNSLKEKFHREFPPPLRIFKRWQATRDYENSHREMFFRQDAECSVIWRKLLREKIQIYLKVTNGKAPFHPCSKHA